MELLSAISVYYKLEPSVVTNALHIKELQRIMDPGTGRWLPKLGEGDGRNWVKQEMRKQGLEFYLDALRRHNLDGLRNLAVLSPRFGITVKPKYQRGGNPSRWCEKTKIYP